MYLGKIGGVFDAHQYKGGSPRVPVTLATLLFRNKSSKEHIVHHLLASSLDPYDPCLQASLETELLTVLAS